MSISLMWRSPVAVLLAVASCVVGAPVQLEGDNIGLGQAVYSQPELAEALARTYEALEWQENRKSQDETRNLDHIGGGNLLRNLDHIGGGNLLRDLESARSRQVREQPSTDKKTTTTRRPGLAHGFRDDHSKWDANRGTLDSLGGGNFVRREINNVERNLDHIGGGNLLRNVDTTQKTTRKPGLAHGFKDDHSQWSPNRGTLDSLGGGNFVGRRMNNVVRNLDHIGGGNLLRDVDTTEKQPQPTRKPWDVGFWAQGFKDYPYEWTPNRGTLDHLGGGNLLRRSANDEARNLDHIGGGNLIRDLGSFGFLLPGPDKTRPWEYSPEDEYRTTLKPGLADGFKDDPSKWSPIRGTLDQIGGGNLLSLAVRDESARNLDHIGGGNLLRDLEESRAEFRKNLDHIGGGNLLRDLEEVHEFERNLDHIGGGNLLRDLDHLQANEN